MRRRGRFALQALLLASLCFCAALAADAAPFDGHDTHDADYAAREAGADVDSSEGTGGGLLESLDADYASPPPDALQNAASGGSHAGYPPAPPRTASSGSDDDVTRFADARDNHFVLTKAAGRLAQMELLEDMALIKDLAVLIISAACGGAAALALGQPSLLGHLAAGAVVGPGGFALVEELIQVETVAQLGVLFMLFGLGLELDGERVRRVRGPALGGAALQLAALAGGGAALGVLGGASAATGALAGAYVAQSSTPLVVRCLQEGRACATPHGELMLALLVLQDVSLGVLLSLLASAGGGEAGGAASRAAKALAALAALLGGAALAARHGGARRALERLAAGPAREHAQLALCAACLAAALAAQRVGLSLEVGAFAGGLALSAPHAATSSSSSLQHDDSDDAHPPHGIAAALEPVRSFFGALFLVAVGMTMRVGFLWAHKGVLIGAACFIALAKAIVTATSLAACGVPRRTAAACGLGLANVGELGFVLLSRALGAGLISRRLFLLLVGTTALSLCATPVVFAAGVRRAARGAPRRGSAGGQYDGDSSASDGGALLPLTAQRGGAGLRARDAKRGADDFSPYGP
jgi:Kef-type K+ transport system membrane component KefB